MGKLPSFRYYVLRCPSCKKKCIVPSRLKTKACPWCNKRMHVNKTTVGKFNDHDEARRSLVGGDTGISFTRASDM